MKNKLIKIIELIGLGITILAISTMVYYLYDLQNQIDERDKLLADKDNKENSLRNNNTDLVESLNKLFDNSSLTADNKFDVVKFIENHNKLKDSLRILKFDNDFIYDVYKIKVNRKYNKDGSTNTSVVNVDGRVDSGLVLLDVYRDRLTKTKDGWSIKTVGKDYEDWRLKFNDLSVKVNGLNDTNNKLIKDYNSLQVKYNNLVDEYNRDVNFYKDMLRKMHNKGIIKIDSSGNETIYQY